MAIALRELDHGRRPPLRVVPAPTPPPLPDRIYWWRRALAVAIAVLLVVATTTMVRALTADRAVAGRRIEMNVVVSSGETLWDIATRYAPAGEDLTSWVTQVAETNGIAGQQVQPGTPIVIPVDSAHVRAVPLNP